MKVDEFKERVSKICAKLMLPQPTIVQERLGSVKLRISLSEQRFIDIYFNEVTGTLNSALVENNRRTTGINGYGARHWHTHPPGRTREHIPVKPMTIEQILRHYALHLRRGRR